MGSNTLQAHQLVALAGRQGQGTEAVGALLKHSDEGRASISDSRVLVDVGGSSACRMWRPCWRLMSFMRRCRTATGSAWRTGGYRWCGAVRAAAHTSKLIRDV
mmetsp:Transcript_29333/g.75302  ORF Transcript_29333/g.75302 Transcript_29333/m.75302 type:complete len:103 (-) Transcript_29333:1058-1366(-)